MTVPRGFGYTGHPRDLIKGTVVPDPGIQYGPFRVLRQTTGAHVVIDTRRSMFEQIVSTHTGPLAFENADAAARRAFANDCRSSIVGSPDGGRRA